jgi:hypothetical protein
MSPVLLTYSRVIPVVDFGAVKTGRKKERKKERKNEAG